MANFTTHIAVGTVVAGGLASLTLAADVIAPENLIAVTMAGVLGSILPDIDLKESRPSRAMFAGLAVFFSFAVLFTFATSRSIAELWILWLGTMAFVRYGLHMAFHRLSVHRGIWHSILAGIFCAIATAVVFRYVLGRHDGVAWLAGGFMFLGYMTHLVLDEMYSVDVMDTRIKSSFGTALKLYDRRYPAATAGMLTACLLTAFLAPSTRPFMEGITSRDLWAGLNERLLPKSDWFGVVPARRTQIAVQPTQAGADGSITTGSVTVPAPGPAPAVERSDAQSQAETPVTVPAQPVGP
jgi:hypothetical protein